MTFGGLFRFLGGGSSVVLQQNDGSHYPSMGAGSGSEDRFMSSTVEDDGDSVSFGGGGEGSYHFHRNQHRPHNYQQEQRRGSKGKAEVPVFQFLQGPRIYSCAHCCTHLTNHDEIISKSFQGRGGRAFLFDKVVNVHLGPCEDRLLITGLHVVADIFCDSCKRVLGWKYEEAYEESQKYKEGKFIVEKSKLLVEDFDDG